MNTTDTNPPDPLWQVALETAQAFDAWQKTHPGQVAPAHFSERLLHAIDPTGAGEPGPILESLAQVHTPAHGPCQSISDVIRTYRIDTFDLWVDKSPAPYSDFFDYITDHSHTVTSSNFQRIASCLTEQDISLAQQLAVQLPLTLAHWLGTLGHCVKNDDELGRADTMRASLKPRFQSPELQETLNQHPVLKQAWNELVQTPNVRPPPTPKSPQSLQSPRGNYFSGGMRELARQLAIVSQHTPSPSPVTGALIKGLTLMNSTLLGPQSPSPPNPTSQSPTL